jgi:hypothetical protein
MKPGGKRKSMASAEANKAGANKAGTKLNRSRLQLSAIESIQAALGVKDGHAAKGLHKADNDEVDLENVVIKKRTVDKRQTESKNPAPSVQDGHVPFSPPFSSATSALSNVGATTAISMPTATTSCVSKTSFAATPSTTPTTTSTTSVKVSVAIKTVLGKAIFEAPSAGEGYETPPVEAAILTREEGTEVATADPPPSFGVQTCSETCPYLSETYLTVQVGGPGCQEQPRCPQDVLAALRAVEHMSSVEQLTLYITAEWFEHGLEVDLDQYLPALTTVDIRGGRFLSLNLASSSVKDATLESCCITKGDLSVTFPNLLTLCVNDVCLGEGGASSFSRSLENSPKLWMVFLGHLNGLAAEMTLTLPALTVASLGCQGPCRLSLFAPQLETLELRSCQGLRLNFVDR